MSEKFKPNAASLVFLMRDNDVLLMKKANTGWLDGYYTLPSGHIDEGESATTAAAREAFEEAGVTIDEAALTCVHVDHRKDLGDDLVYIDFFFITNTWNGEPYNAEPEKCSEVAWFDIDSMPENTVEIVKNALAGYKNGTFYSELGW